MVLRTSLVAQPHLYMGDTTGRPLDAGKVYFGQPNKDPELYPINVFYDEALTIAAPQPIRTMGGFMNANGQMVEIYAAETTYSVKVLDGYGRQVFYQDDMSSTSTSASVSTKLPYIGAIDRNMADKNTDYITPKDFGATGNTEADLLGLSVIGLNEGSIIHTDNRSFTIAASNATDYDAITAGGAKLYINKEPTSFATRAEFVAAVADGLKIKKNTIIQAGNVSYIYDKTSTEILDLPSFKPFGEVEFEHYGGRTDTGEATRAVVSHYRASVNEIVDVVRIVNPKVDTFGVKNHPDMGEGGASPRMSLRELSKLSKSAAMVNGGGFINADGTSGSDKDLIRPYGVLIADGKVWSDWDTSPNLARDQAMIFTKDGKLKARKKADGDAADYVAEGALWGYSWGAWCVLDGVAQTVPTDLMADVVSARTIIGQADNGDFIIITAEGVSGSYGLTPNGCAAVALEHGCKMAFVSDGGGSTQLWWDNFYILPSSDNEFSTERTLCTALAINCPLETYDSEWINQELAAGFTAYSGVGVRVRQINSTVFTEIGVQGSFNTTSVNVLANPRSLRYNPQNGNAVGRGAVVGGGGVSGAWNLAAGLSMRTVVDTITAGYLAGAASWSTKHALSKTTP